MSCNRTPRFQRINSFSPIKITSRDADIIGHVFRHRFLRSTHIANLVGGSQQQVLRRLQRLFHHGYLDRPRAQIEHYRNGSKAMAYGIGHRGAKFLHETRGIPHRKLDWSAKNRAATRFFIEHTLAVADVMVAIEVACRKRSDIELIPHKDEPLKWKVDVRHHGVIHRIGVIPDRVFGLRHKDRPNDTCWYFLEADRGTMPVMRRSLKQTSFARKLLAYEATWRQGTHRNRLALLRFRVLAATTSHGRVAKLTQVASELERGHGLFLFANAQSLSSSDPLAFSWTNAHGEHSTLLDGISQFGSSPRNPPLPTANPPES